MAHRYTKGIEALHQAVTNIQNELDTRLGIAFKVKTQGHDVIITLNTVEKEIINREDTIKEKLIKYSNEFVTAVKKEYKKITGNTLTLSNKRQEMISNTANYAGDYFVTVLNVFDGKSLFKEE